MKKNQLLGSILLISVISINAQVGIGTTNPQEALHVAGDISSIRIDGFNANNNLVNDATKNVLVTVDENGTLLLRPSALSRFNQLDGILPSAVVVETKDELGIQTGVLYSTQMTPTTDVLLKISYQVGTKITRHGSPDQKIDQNHQSKLFGTRLLINNNQIYGDHSRTITSDDKYFDGIVYLNSSVMVKLEANTTYTIDLIGYVHNSDEDDSGIRASYGLNGINDYIQFFEIN